MSKKEVREVRKGVSLMQRLMNDVIDYSWRGLSYLNNEAKKFSTAANDEGYACCCCSCCCDCCGGCVAVGTVAANGSSLWQ